MNNLLGDARIGMLQQALSGLARRPLSGGRQYRQRGYAGLSAPACPSSATARREIGGSARLAGTAAGHHDEPCDRRPAQRLGAGQSPERTASPRNDDNNVDIDYEMTQLVETNLRYQLLTQATSARFTTLRDIVMRIS
ncbi:MAG: hypothetical protein U0531_07120 [Dehalococcoidia bacterium]